MTVSQIREALAPHKPVSTAQLCRYLEALKIEPIGARQKPQHYPADTPNQILKHFGFGRIITLNELRAERRKAQRSRKARAA